MEKPSSEMTATVMYKRFLCKYHIRENMFVQWQL